METAGRPKPRGVWDATECALILMDYQDSVLEGVFEQDHRLLELNVSTLAKAARAFGIPVVLSTVGVELGANGPTLPSIISSLPGVEPTDRSSMNAWEDSRFRRAVEATGRKRLVMGGILTSVCLAYPVISALADGYDVCFIEDAVADITKEIHDMAVLRLVQAGAVPNTTQAMMSEWFRDWKSPMAEHARQIYPRYRDEWAALRRNPEHYEPIGLAAQSARAKAFDARTTSR